MSGRLFILIPSDGWRTSKCLGPGTIMRGTRAVWPFGWQSHTSTAQPGENRVPGGELDCVLHGVRDHCNCKDTAGAGAGAVDDGRKRHRACGAGTTA